jgi:hypothetical protein
LATADPLSCNTPRPLATASPFVLFCMCNYYPQKIKTKRKKRREI